jgi:hypothetical protein
MLVVAVVLAGFLLRHRLCCYFWNFLHNYCRCWWGRWSVTTNNAGSNGNNSVFSTITSAGGGAGGAYTAGSNGGSGGGGAHNTQPGGTGNTPASASPPDTNATQVLETMVGRTNTIQLALLTLEAVVVLVLVVLGQVIPNNAGTGGWRHQRFLSNKLDLLFITLVAVAVKVAIALWASRSWTGGTTTTAEKGGGGRRSNRQQAK